MPAGKFQRISELAPKGINSEAPEGISGIFIPKGDPSWRQKEVNSEGQRDNFYVVYNFYVDTIWCQKEIIPRYQRDIFSPAGQFLRSAQFLRRYELAPKELILRYQRDIFAPTEFEIQIWV